jgi:hypothetical protein
VADQKPQATTETPAAATQISEAQIAAPWRDRQRLLDTLETVFSGGAHRG